MRANLDAFAITMLSALGLMPLGCGGETTGGDGGSGGGGTTSPFPCTSPQDVVPGASSGYERCGETNYVHRPTRVECPSALPRVEACSADPNVAGGSCAVDSDCADQPNGHCEQAVDYSGCYCAYGCRTDDDCVEGQICFCGEAVGQCVQASCTTDDDCGSGLFCSSYVANPGCGGTAFACQTAQDTCASDADCVDGAMCGLENGRHVCVQPGCVIGRPFLVDGRERLAPTVRGTDWIDVEVSVDRSRLDARTCAALAERWTEIGRMEQASIAAFARFALQLLSLAAPPELLDETHAAMVDETAHARVAFSLASAYGAAPVSPGPLALEGALDEGDLAEIVKNAILEGCIGETIAAVEAAEGALGAGDEKLCRILEKVAADETRHAQLAWRFVAWVQGRSIEDALLVEQAFAQALSEVRRRAALGPRDDLVEHGLLGETARQALRERVLREVIEPCARALCQRVVALRRLVNNTHA